MTDTNVESCVFVYLTREGVMGHSVARLYELCEQFAEGAKPVC